MWKRRCLGKGASKRIYILCKRRINPKGVLSPSRHYCFPWGLSEIASFSIRLCIVLKIVSTIVIKQFTNWGFPFTVSADQQKIHHSSHFFIFPFLRVVKQFLLFFIAFRRIKRSSFELLLCAAVGGQIKHINCEIKKEEMSKQLLHLWVERSSKPETSWY